MRGKKYIYPIVLVLTLVVGVLLMYSIWGAVSPRTASQFLESGKQYFEQNKHPEAVVEFLNALQKDPREREARFFLARSYLALNDPASAVKELRSLLEYYPDDAEASIQLGDIYLAGGRVNSESYRESRQLAEKVLAKDANNIPAMVLLGNAMAGLQDYTAAVEQFERALKLDPQSPLPLLGLGWVQAQQKKYAEAEEAFLKARQADPRNKAALISLGNFYVSIGRLSDAEPIFKEALSLYPAEREIYLSAVAFYNLSNRFEEAEKVLKEAQAAKPTDPSPSLSLVGYYRALNREADAQSLLRDLKKSFPEDTTVSLELAAALMRDDPAAARTEIDAILKADPQNVPAQMTLGELQFRERQYDQAVTTLTAPSILNSRYPRVHLLLGLVYAGKGQTDKALDHYKNSLNVDPAYTPSRLALAELLFRLGRVADTKVELAEVLKAQPANYEARLLKAGVDTIERRFADAERELTALQKEQPDNAIVHLRRGLLYQLRGMGKEAETSVLRALELQPESDDILQAVVQFYMVRQSTDRALRIIQDTVPETKRRAFHHELMGLVYAGANRSQEAEAAYRKALQLEPDRASSKAQLASEYVRVQRYDEALKQIDDLLKQVPGNAGAYATKGLIFQTQGKLDLAKENYDRALKLDANTYVAANNLAYLLAEEGRDLEVALTWAQTARRLQPDNPASADTLGWVQHKLGRNVLARDQLEFAVSKLPGNPTLQYHLAMIYKETKQIPQAQAALRKALGGNSEFKEKSLAEAALKELSSAR